MEFTVFQLVSLAVTAAGFVWVVTWGIMSLMLKRGFKSIDDLSVHLEATNTALGKNTVELAKLATNLDGFSARTNERLQVLERG